MVSFPGLELLPDILLSVVGRCLSMRNPARTASGRQARSESFCRVTLRQAFASNQHSSTFSDIVSVTADSTCLANGIVMMIRICSLCVLVLLASGRLQGEGNFFVYAADQKNRQVLRVRIDSSGREVIAEQFEPFRLPFAPTSIANSARGNRLYVSGSSLGEPAMTPAATIEVLAAGELRLGPTTSLQHPTGYTSVDRSGSFFLTVHYRTGKVGVYRVRDDGGLGAATSSLTTPRPEAHCILTTPGNDFVYIPCVKTNNALFQYAFDQQTGRLTPLKPFDASPPAMFGPRHVAYHPSLPIAYFSNEQQLGVSVYEIGEEGQLSDRQHATTIPRRSPYEKGKRGLHASDLVLTPDGKRLLVAVRDFVDDEDSVFAFRVEEDGRLSQMGRTRVGDIPWKLDLSPGGEFLLVSTVGDSRLTVLEVQPAGGLRRAASVDWGVGIRDMVVCGAR